MQRLILVLVAMSFLICFGEAGFDCERYNKTQYPFCECTTIDNYFLNTITCGLEKRITIKTSAISILIECKQVDTLEECAELIPKLYFEGETVCNGIRITKPRISSDDITYSKFLDKLNINNLTVLEFPNYQTYPDGLVFNGENGSYYTWATIYQYGYDSLKLYHSNSTGPGSISYSTHKYLEYLEINKMTLIPDDALSKLTFLKQIVFSKNDDLQLTSTLLKPLKKLEKLKLFNNIITNELSNDTFSALNNLNVVIMMNNTFNAIPDNLFDQTKMLEIVQFNHNNIPNIILPKLFLANLPELMKVDLSYSSLEEISSDTFKNSTQIEKIKLNNNKLGLLPSNVFKDLVNLEELDLSCNQIKSVQTTLFQKLTSLEVLNINNNFITEMKRFHFATLSQLRTLLMSRNNLSSFVLYGDSSTSFSNLKTIDLAQNQLDFHSESPFWEFQALVNVNVSHNNISRYEIYWSKSMELRSLDISYNYIESLEFVNIHSDSLLKSKDIVIDLTHNKISSLDNFTYHQLDPIKGSSDRRLVLVGNNPIICDCEVFNFIKYLKEHRGDSLRSIVNLIAEDVQCAAPADKVHKQLLDLDMAELTCPLNKENWCPDECNCQFRPNDRAIIVHCEGSSIKQIKGLPKIHITRNVESINIESFEIHLENNNLSELPIFDDYVTKLHLNGNRFTDLAVDSIPKNITFLDIRGNLLGAMTKDTLEGILNKSQLKQIYLAENPLQCDCSNLDLISSIQVNQVKIADYTSVTCADGRKISELAMVAQCNVPSSHTAAAIVNGVIAGISVIVAGFIYYKYRQITRARTTEEYSLIPRT